MLSFSDFNDKDIPNCKLCRDCLGDLYKQHSLRFDKASLILDNLIQQSGFEESKEPNAEKKLEAARKAIEQSAETYNKEKEAMEKERDRLYQEILEELNDVLVLEDQIADMQFSSFQLEEDVEKVNHELLIEKLKNKSLMALQPVEKVFEIKLSEEYGSIKQFEIRFPPKPDFSSKSHWVKINSGIGEVLWLTCYLSEVASVKKNECEIRVQGSDSEIKCGGRILKMSGPFKDGAQRRDFDQGIEIINDLSVLVCNELGKKVKLQTSSPIFEAKLPNKVGKGEVGKVPTEFSETNIRRWELAMRNVLENLDFSAKLLATLTE